MAKLKLPRVPRDPASTALPPELRWDAPPAAGGALLLLGRREFLKALVVVLAALAAPVTAARRAVAAARGRFFDRRELATLEALCDRIIPPDTDATGTPSPGGRDLGAAQYIDRLLAAFDHRVPLIYAGGPFSNRNPFPDNKRGVPSRRRPRNAFKRFIRLTRLQEIRWRAELYGSDSPRAPGASFNDTALGPLKGLQQLYREGLKKVDDVAQAVAGGAYASLSTDDQDRVLVMLDAAFAPEPRRGGTFMDVLIGHTIEGCLAAPEYGGNRRLAGWKLIGLEGDNQPLGFSVFSRDLGDYRERTDHPMSTPNPDEIAGPRPISQAAHDIQAAIANLATLVGPVC